TRWAIENAEHRSQPRRDAVGVRRPPVSAAGNLHGCGGFRINDIGPLQRRTLCRPRVLVLSGVLRNQSRASTIRLPFQTESPIGFDLLLGGQLVRQLGRRVSKDGVKGSGCSTGAVQKARDIDAAVTGVICEVEPDLVLKDRTADVSEVIVEMRELVAAG